MQIDNIKLSIVNRNATIGIIGLRFSILKIKALKWM